MAQDGVNEARLRVNRSAVLNLTTTWQDVVFNGTSTLNVNTFGNNPDNNKPMTYYDTATNTFRFQQMYDKNPRAWLFPEVLATVLGTNMVTLQYRLVIPNGVSPGVDSYNPYRDTAGYADAFPIASRLTEPVRMPLQIPLVLSSAVRANGVKIQLRCSAPLIGIGAVQLTSCAALILE